VDVVLVRPSRAANVAAACRAMKNMGLGSLSLVGAPAIGPADRALAYGAWDVLDGARQYGTLAEAVSGCTFVAGTSGRGAPQAWTPRRLAEERASRAGPGRTAVVFGPEATGLAREELRLCHEVVHIATHPDHSSLNLAQAVLVVAYELRLGAGPGGSVTGDDRVDAGELEACLLALEEGLLAIGYLDPGDPGRILAELRGLLARAGPTRREITLLRGIARQASWAGAVASSRRGSG